jgi:hypothetical protein
VVVKEELGTPSASAPRKRKAHISVDAGPLWSPGQLELDDEAGASTHSVGKRARTSTNSSNVRFDGVVIQKPTRRSTRVAKATTALRNDVAHVCRRIGQELGVVARSFSDFADAFE